MPMVAYIQTKYFLRKKFDIYVKLTKFSFYNYCNISVHIDMLSSIM